MEKETNDQIEPVLEPLDIQRPASAAPTESQLEQQLPGGSSTIGHDPYAALRIRGYQLYSMGWLASVIGQQVQSVAVGWQLFQRAESVRAGAGARMGRRRAGAAGDPPGAPRRATGGSL